MLSGNHIQEAACRAAGRVRKVRRGIIALEINKAIYMPRRLSQQELDTRGLVGRGAY
jgi:hypothetical protein